MLGRCVKSDMNTSACECGNELFFDSMQCVACGIDVGLCEACHEITPIRKMEDDTTCCQHCETPLIPCWNRETHGVCNVWTVPGDESGLCEFCRLTTVIPDLTVAGNQLRWKALEAAKRRVIVGVELAGFPTSEAFAADDLPLTFEFKADGPAPVATGHANGCITINIREADPVEREKTRVKFGEPQRTLVGHFRHELGHYYWDLLVKSTPQLVEYRKLFGDETNPDYDTARKRYYAEGPQPDWQETFISAYASMHPWEDFAESFGALLDMIAVLETARHFGILNESDTPLPAEEDFESLLLDYQGLGVAVNELNREMGLLDLVPEVMNETAREKLRFVYELGHSSASNAEEKAHLTA